MVEEVIKNLAIKKNGMYFDVTAGLGGHSSAIFEAMGKTGTLVLMDRDFHAIQFLKQKFSAFPSIHCVHANYSSIVSVWKNLGLQKIDGILADLGVSSFQLESKERGFSFLEYGPLDMRMDQSETVTLKDCLFDIDESKLAQAILQYGDEPEAIKIARSIKQEIFHIHDTKALADLIARTKRLKKHKIHPATQTFQALRILLNDEFGHLEKFLKEFPLIMKAGGRAAFITFHSHESKRVKSTLAQYVKPNSEVKSSPWCRLVSKKAIKPSRSETLANPRSRSALLRVIELTSEYKNME